MNMSDMKNIIVLRDLPSNLVDEAIVVLKQNQRIKKPQYVDLDNKQIDKNSNKEKGNFKDHIIKEAEMLVSEYISKIESKGKAENKIIDRKYKKSIKINVFLIIMLLLSIGFNLIG